MIAAGVVVAGSLAAVGIWSWNSARGSTAVDRPVSFETVVLQAPVTPPPGVAVATTAPPAPPATAEPTTAETATSAAGDAAASGTEVTPDGAPPGEVPSVTASTPGGPAAAYSVIENATIYLRGAVPDQDTAQRVADDLAFRRGGEVVNQLEIDPEAPEPGAIPLYVPAAGLFAEDRAELLEGIGPTLDIVGTLLLRSDGTKLVIRGHTDDRGSEAYNFALSQQRIAAVFAYLVRAGVDPLRLEADPRGEVEPIADNATADGRARNRRVELVLVPA